MITSSTLAGAVWVLMEYKLKEKKGDDIMNTLEKCYTSFNVSFDPNYIDRAHRIGLLRADNQSREKVKSMIRSWKARQLFNKGRPRYHTDGSKKPGFSVSVD